jgi:hypothetical protein
MRGAIVVALAAACGGSSSSSDGGAGTPAPDPRFKWVGAYSSYTLGAQYVGGNNITLGSTTTVYAPAAVGSGGEALSFSFMPPAALTFMSAYGETGAMLDIAGSDQVVTSLAYTDGYHVVTSQSASATMMSMATTAASATNLVEVVENLGQMNAVTTAIAFDGSTIQVLAYVDSRGSNTYAATVMTCDVTTVGSMTTSLAGDGYVITALGPIDGGSLFGVVGTSIGGSATPHSAMSVTYAVGGDSSALAAAETQGYAVVGGYFSDPLTAVFVLER